MVEGRDTISGRPSEEIMEKLIQKVITIKKEAITKYDRIRSKSKFDHTIKILDELIALEQRDIEILENAEVSPNIHYARKTGVAEDYEVLDHMISPDEKMVSDDPRTILAWSINKSDQIYKMAQILSEEYEDPDLKTMLQNIAQSELKRKNRISELYDDIVNRDYW
ncbi:MAG: hypothetical protein M1496_07805 [Candidatus Thermoplasmatota archaeon]|jgi:hypothetical protein|nr:hypothetical protein [Candidatus Thermoplasmatota archaeon]